MMENPGGANSSNPLSDQQRPEQPMGGAQGNPLARLAPQMGGAQQPMPAPDRGQTIAAVKRFSAIQQALKPVLSNPNLGRENVRPEVLDAGSRILGTKLISLPQLMSVLNDFPTDPLDQKAAVQKIYDQAQQSESLVLDAHGAAIAAGKLPPDGGDEYESAQHEQHMDGLLKHFKV